MPGEPAPGRRVAPFPVRQAWAAAAAVLAALGALGGCARTHREHWVFPAVAAVQLDARDGSCTLREGPPGRTTVDVSWTYPDEAGYLPDSLAALDSIVLTETIAHPGPGQASWTLTVPPGTRVRVSTGGGDVSASRTRISLTARTEAGALRFDRVEGRLVASTGSGAISVTGFAATGDSAFGSERGTVAVSLSRPPAAGLFLFSDSGSLSLDYGANPLTGEFHLECVADAGSLSSAVPLDEVRTENRNGTTFTVGTLRRGTGTPLVRLLTRTGTVALAASVP